MVEHFIPSDRTGATDAGLGQIAVLQLESDICMKLRIFFIVASIFLTLLSACNSGGMFLTQGLSRSISASTIDEGSVLGSSDEIPVTVDADAMNAGVDLVVVTLENSKGQVIGEAEYEGSQLTFPNLEPLILQTLDSGVYLLNIELFENGESLGTEESWFFFSDTIPELKQITLTPHSVVAGGTVSVSLELDSFGSRTPYVQFRLNGSLVHEGLATDGLMSFDLAAPEQSGIYDLELDIYPWFDQRIDEGVYSPSSATVELLVVPSGQSPSTAQVVVDASQQRSLEESLWYFESGRIATRIVLETNRRPGLAQGELFTISGENALLEAELSSSGIELNLTIDNRQLSYPVSFRSDQVEEIQIDLLEGETHLTLLVSGDDRLLSGEVIPYDEFTNVQSGRDVSSFTIANLGIDSATISSLTGADNLTSLFQLILQKKYGTFVLFAEGFEFASAVNQAISYSNDAFVRDGYLVLPPGAWVEFPDFSLDEYEVEIEAGFHPEDDLSDAEIQLLQEKDGEYIQIFRLDGSGNLRSAGVNIGSFSRLSEDTSFQLSRTNGSIRFSMDEREAYLPNIGDGRYRLMISQSQDVQMRIRLDSASAANTAEEFVDKILNNLP